MSKASEWAKERERPSFSVKSNGRTEVFAWVNDNGSLAGFWHHEARDVTHAELAAFGQWLVEWFGENV